MSEQTKATALAFRQSRRLLIPVISLLALLAVVTPVVAGLVFARQQSFSAEQRRAKSIATEVLRRTDATRSQLKMALDELHRAPAPEPCSSNDMQHMASAVLEFELLQGAGFVRDGKLICTSAGLLSPPIDIGHSGFPTANGYWMRPVVQLPFAPGVKLLAVTDDSGYTLFIHPSLTLDIPLNNENEAVGIIGISTGQIINQRGLTDESLLESFRVSKATNYVTKGQLVSVAPSNSGDYAGFSAIPMTEVTEDFARYLTFLLPISIACGGLLLLLLRFAVRLESSMATTARRALKSDQIYLQYQPIIDLATNRWVGAEALARWKRPTGEHIRPDLFVPVMEETGLISLLTEKVFQIIAKEAGPYLSQRQDFYLTINLAPADLSGDRLSRLVNDLLVTTGCNARHFALEVTERGLVDAQDGRKALEAVRAQGFRIALDDFGTGYSSLAYLQKFQLDYIKIDKSFVDSIETEAATSSVITHIINMARDLNLGLIAEGVETEKQARFLHSRGVSSGQGWLFAKPLDWAQLIAALDQQKQA